jgi:triosephosphate isomerase
MSSSKEFYVANWKQSGKRGEALKWVLEMGQEKNLLADMNKVIIVCPPLKALDLMEQEILIKQLPIAVGIQDIDVKIFEGEKNTGAQSPALLANSATYVIIGHSETRRNNKLTDQDVVNKVKASQDAGLITIVCVEEVNQAKKLKELFGNYSGIIAYEPPSAIGTGNAASPQDANRVAMKIKEVLPSTVVLYGGSVDGKNIKGFVQQSEIGGVLVGNKSLDASFFKDILRNA